MLVTRSWIKIPMSGGMILVNIKTLLSLYSAHQNGILHNYEIKYMSFNNNVAGLEHAKKCIDEMVIYPLQRPDIFMGCRAPGRGLLLFGPPVSTNISCDGINCQDWSLISLLF